MSLLKIYSRLFIPLCLLLFACSKPAADPDPVIDPPIPPVITPTNPQSLSTKGLLLGIDQDFSQLYYRFNFSNKRRLTSFDNFEGSYHVYYVNDTIGYVVSPIKPSGTGYDTKTSWIFEYDLNKKVVRVTEQASVATVADTSSSLANASASEYQKMDSIVYNSSGQLSEIWEFSKPGCCPRFKHGVVRFYYETPQSENPFSCKEFVYYDGVVETYLSEVKLTMSETPLPARQQIWFMSFMFIDMPCTPIHHYDYGARYYLSLLKNVVTHYHFVSQQNSNFDSYSLPFRYFFNADSTEFTGRIDNNDYIDQHFKYYFSR